MSRLSGSPLRKPSPFQFPLGPPSPPETNTDTVIGSGHILPPPQSFAAQDFAPIDAGLHGTIPDMRGKRSSSIPYHSTTFRDPKERTLPTRSNRSLVIVIPPSTLIQDHQHGSTLSNGPYHRLSQGVVLPIFPSIFGQLTAIAKEFNFPSTVGLCLYFHYVEGDLTLKPRISDESWQSLWAHLSDPVGPNDRKFPIGGKVEFDIDLRLARWYPIWLASVHRDIADYTSHITHPSIATSLTHHRADSSVLGRRPSDDDVGDNSTFHQQRNTSVGRHVPRTLSLVERFDVASVRSDSKPNPHSVALSTEMAPTSQTLSTIMQVDEPNSGREQLDNRVKSWRASALISPTPLAAKGQSSLDPPNLPNNIPIGTSLDPPGSTSDETERMNLEDYTWSVTSAGPQSCGEISPVSWVHAPSVHLAQRLQGSVCTSPLTCTSFGPDDEDAYSYASTSSPIASVHLAERLQGSVCTSPSTCTSFGPDDDDVIYYVPSFSRIPTPDIASRHFEDCPLTPMTATSWGAPLSYPPSPRCYSPTPSLDLGERSMFQDDIEAPLLQHVRNVGQSSTVVLQTVTPWQHVWPYNTEIPDKSADPSSHMALTASSTQHESVEPWTYVWPYINLASAGAPSPSELSSAIPAAGYPYFNIYPTSYPHLEIYPSLPADISARMLTQDKMDEVATVDVKLLASYPTMEIYQPVYPYNLDTIYPVVAQQGVEREIISSQAEYPFLSIYPAVYGPLFSHFSLYTCNPHSQYPDFDIYPSTANNSSPFVTALDQQARSEPSIIVQMYPFLNIYPAVYPHFDIYPSISANLNETTLTSEPLSSLSSPHNVWLGTTLQATYPFFNLYPAVYPYFDIYPGYPETSRVGDNEIEVNEKAEMLSLTPMLPPIYPSFNLYPSVYPHLDIYPAPYDFAIDPQAVVEKEPTFNSSLSPTLPPSYPSFNLYPSLYPYLTIYPGPYGEVDDIQHGQIGDSAKELNPFLTIGYPYFTLYPPVYPHFNIYPSLYFGVSSNCREPEPSVALSSYTGSVDVPYPFFNLYPAVYPYFDLYLPRPMTALEPPKKRSKPKSRLTHLELHAMVMMERAALRGPSHDFQSHSFQMPSVPPDLDENVSNYMQETAAANVARNLHISTSAVPLLSRETPKKSAPYSSGSAIFLSSPIKGQQEPHLLRKTLPQPPVVSRPTSLREPLVKPPIPPRQSPLGTRRRDSLVIQRVRAFDQSENSGMISKETLARFPMPPRAFPPLPPLPQDRQQ